MHLEIKEVRRCKNGAYGNFYVIGHESIFITISREKNNTTAEYAATLLHELLHFWMTLLRLKGFRCTNIREHTFIYAVEDAVLKMAKKHLKGRAK